MAATIAEFARSGLLNIVGGCTDTTPEHVSAMAEVVKNLKPRPIPTYNLPVDFQVRALYHQSRLSFCQCG